MLTWEMHEKFWKLQISWMLPLLLLLLRLRLLGACLCWDNWNLGTSDDGDVFRAMEEW